MFSVFSLVGLHRVLLFLDSHIKENTISILFVFSGLFSINVLIMKMEK